jgi:hypothetical protein
MKEHTTPFCDHYRLAMIATELLNEHITGLTHARNKPLASYQRVSLQTTVALNTVIKLTLRIEAPVPDSSPSLMFRNTPDILNTHVFTHLILDRLPTHRLRSIYIGDSIYIIDRELPRTFSRHQDLTFNIENSLEDTYQSSPRPHIPDAMHVRQNKPSLPPHTC